MRAVITLGFESDNELNSEELKRLFLEQWEQTAAAGEGDYIEVIGVEIID